jgi:hypothetical protein
VHALHEIVCRAIGNHDALVDDDGARAHRFDFFEDVGRNDDRLVGGHVGDELANVMFLIGIETIRRLVHNENGRIVKDRLGQPDAALITLRQRIDDLIHDGLEPRALDRPVHARLYLRPPKSADFRNE